jgi:integrase
MFAMRIVKPLTDTKVREAKPKPPRQPREYNLADGKGLFLRVKINGTKLWIFNYFKPYTTSRTNISIGAYPNYSLKDARKVSTEYRALLAKGMDPKEEKKRIHIENAEAHANTFQTIAEKWLATKSDLSTTYFFKIQQGFDNHVFPKMGKTPIHKLTAPKVISYLEPLAERGASETISKVCRWINEVMTFAVNTGVIHHNPLAGIRVGFKKTKAQNMPTIKPEELPEFMQTLNESSATLTIKSLIEWQLHTMVRPGEAAGTRWDEIDLDNKVWIIPEERMKTGNLHTVPLSAQAISILETMSPLSEHREHVFPSSTTPNKAASSQSANMAIKRMGYKGKLVSHGLRALASTTLNEQDFPHDVIEVALAHIDQNSIRAAYNRAEYLEQRRVMMQWWSDHIYDAATGNLNLSSSKHLKVVKANKKTGLTPLTNSNR